LAARPQPKAAHPVARLAATVEGQLEAAGSLGVRTAKFTEQQVVRELLWMLRCPADSPLFELGEVGWRVRPLVTVPSLTAPALASLLGEALPGLNAVHVLRAFTAATEEPGLVAPHTLEAYASGLTSFLQQFSSWLCELEGELTGQGLTLLGAMDRLRPWVHRLATLAAVHGHATHGFRTTENWYKSIRLLSVLYNSLSSATSQSLLPTLLELLVVSLRPYLAIVQGWLGEGRLEDWQREFIIHRRPGADGQGEDFWHSEFLCRDYRQRLAREGIEPLGLLEGLDTKILASGKSIELLNRLDHIFRGERKIAFTDSEDQVKELFATFLSSLQAQLGGGQGAAREEPAPVLDPELTAIVESSDCPYLALAMKEVFLAATSGSSDPREAELLPGVGPDTLIPLQPLLRRALAPSIQAHYRRACHTLVDLFITELKLEAVLSRARSVFFLEAGDLMHQFCSELFQLTEPGAGAAGAPSLSLLLQDALGPRYPAWADTFTVERRPEEHGLGGIRIHMAAPWPLALVFTRVNIDTYNKVFLFLAGVKRSLWALESIRVHRLRELEEQQALDVSSLSLPSQDVSLPLPCKQHRLQLLRSWLLYFTTTVHGYFMSRVVHTTEVELRGRLATATDLDMILAVHQEYLDRIHDRCFLHPSAAMLREAVTMVLGLGVELQQAVLSELPIHTQSLLAWEERYMHCHKFLASTLQAMTGRRRLPHLEGLTVALLHSCPA
jgi:gamma-tubulin complex component 5